MNRIWVEAFVKKANQGHKASNRHTDEGEYGNNMWLIWRISVNFIRIWLCQQTRPLRNCISLQVHSYYFWECFYFIKVNIAEAKEEGTHRM